MSIPLNRNTKEFDFNEHIMQANSKQVVSAYKTLKPQIQQSTAEFLKPSLTKQLAVAKVNIGHFEKQNLFSGKKKLNPKNGVIERQNRILYGSLEFKETGEEKGRRKDLSPAPFSVPDSSIQEKGSIEKSAKTRSDYFQNLKTNFKSHVKPSLNSLIKKDMETSCNKNSVDNLNEAKSENAVNEQAPDCIEESSPLVQENRDWQNLNIPECIKSDKDNNDLEISPRHVTPRERVDSARKLSNLLTYKGNPKANNNTAQKKVNTHNLTENRFFKKKPEPSVQSLSVQKDKVWANNSSNVGSHNPYGSVPKLAHYNDNSVTSPYSKGPSSVDPKAQKLAFSSAIKHSERGSNDRYNLFDVGLTRKEENSATEIQSNDPSRFFFKPVQKELMSNGGIKIDFEPDLYEDPIKQSMSRSKITGHDRNTILGMRDSEFIAAVGSHRNSPSPIASTFQELKVVVNPIKKSTEEVLHQQRPSSPTFNIEVIKNQERFKPRNSLDFKQKDRWQNPFGQFPSSTTNSMVKVDGIEKPIGQSIRNVYDGSFKGSLYSSNYHADPSQERTVTDSSIKDKIFKVPKNLKKTDAGKIMINPYDPSFNTRNDITSEKSNSFFEKNKQQKLIAKPKTKLQENLSDASSTQNPKSMANPNHIQIINYKHRDRKINDVTSPISRKEPSRLELSRKERLIKRMDAVNSSLAHYNSENDPVFINLKILADNNGQDLLNLKTYIDTFIGNFERRGMLLEDIASLQSRISLNNQGIDQVKHMLAKIRNNVDLNKQMVNLNNEKCLVINNLNSLQNDQMEIHEYLETIDYKMQTFEEEKQKQSEVIHKLGLKLQEYVHTSTIYRQNFIQNIVSKIKYLNQESQNVVMKIIQEVIGFDCASLREQVKNCTVSHAESVFANFNDKLAKIAEQLEDKASPRATSDFKAELKVFVKITRQYNGDFIDKYRSIVNAQRRIEEFKTQETELNNKRTEFVLSAEKIDKEIEAAQLSLNKINAEKIQLRFQQNNLCENQYNFNDTMNSTKFDNFDEELLHTEELFECQLESLLKTISADQRNVQTLSVRAEGFERIFIENFATIIGLAKDILFNTETENEKIHSLMENANKDRKQELQKKLDENQTLMQHLQQVITQNTFIEQISYSFISINKQRSTVSDYSTAQRQSDQGQFYQSSPEKTNKADENSAEEKQSNNPKDNLASINRLTTVSENEKRTSFSHTEKLYDAIQPIFEIQSFLISTKNRKDVQFLTRPTNKISKTIEEIAIKPPESSQKKAKIALNSPALKIKARDLGTVGSFTQSAKQNEEKKDLWEALYKKFYPVFNLRADELRYKLEEGVSLFKRLNDSSFNYLEFLENARDKVYVKKVIEKSFVRAILRYDPNTKIFLLMGNRNDVWDKFDAKSIESILLSDHSMQSLRLKAFDRVSEFEVNIYNQAENAKKVYKMLSSSNFFEFSLFNKNKETSFLMEGLHSLLSLVFSVQIEKLETLENEYYAY